MLTESNKDRVSEEQLAEWDAAMDEYFMLEEANAKKPAGWDTEIPELIVSGITQDELAHVQECLRGVGTVEGSRPMRLAARIELAAYFVAGALDHAFDSAHGTGHPEAASELFDTAAELIIRRAREIYARGPAPDPRSCRSA